jgi:hypothetical protein
MLGHKIHIANLKAIKRFKKWYPDWRPEFHERRLGILRKTNVVCSCHMCRNPRHSNFTPKSERPTVQERRAPDVDDFEY